MDNAGSQVSLLVLGIDRGALKTAPRQEAIDQSPRAVTATRMDHQSRRLVHHNQMSVLEHNIDGNAWIGKRLRGQRRIRADFHLGTRTHLVLGPNRLSVHEHPPTHDPTLYFRPRNIRHPRRYPTVNALAGLVFRDHISKDFRLTHQISLLI
jgi:hypothetical protein